MRAGPLSNQKVIALLNAHFVPVYAVNEDYRDDSAKPPAERAEYRRILKESHAARISTGTVHVYLLDPQGRPVDSLHVAEAAKTPALLKMLERAVARFRVPAGKPLVEPRPQSKAPACEPDALVLNLVSRALKGGGSWGGVVENWIVLDREAQNGFMPPAPDATAWLIRSNSATLVLTHFYPSTENNDVGRNEFESLSLDAKLLERAGGTIRARLDGKMKMRHSFYGKEDGRVVEATVVGLMEWDAKNQRIRALKLVTEEATYGGGNFGVAVRSLP